jgi:hypothetical protein
LECSAFLTVSFGRSLQLPNKVLITCCAQNFSSGIYTVKLSLILTGSTSLESAIVFKNSSNFSLGQSLISL